MLLGDVAGWVSTLLGGLGLRLTRTELPSEKDPLRRLYPREGGAEPEKGDGFIFPALTQVENLQAK